LEIISSFELEPVGAGQDEGQYQEGRRNEKMGGLIGLGFPKSNLPFPSLGDRKTWPKSRPNTPPYVNHIDYIHPHILESLSNYDAMERVSSRGSFITDIDDTTSSPLLTPTNNVENVDFNVNQVLNDLESKYQIPALQMETIESVGNSSPESEQDQSDMNHSFDLIPEESLDVVEDTMPLMPSVPDEESNSDPTKKPISHNFIAFIINECLFQYRLITGQLNARNWIFKSSEPW
jgi:hypothetical protein